MTLVTGFTLRSDSEHNWLQAVSKSQEWQNVINQKPLDIIDSPLKEVFLNRKLKLSNSIILAWCYASWIAILTYSLRKIQGLVVAPPTYLDGTVICSPKKEALISGGVVGVIASVLFSKNVYDHCKGYTSEDRIKWADDMLAYNNATLVVTVNANYCDFIPVERKLQVKSYSCHISTLSLRDICYRSGLVWATLEHIKNKKKLLSAANWSKIEELQAEAVKDFNLAFDLANALLNDNFADSIKNQIIDETTMKYELMRNGCFYFHYQDVKKYWDSDKGSFKVC